MDNAAARGYRRIATEEAWITKELADRYLQLLERGDHGDPGFDNLWGFFGRSQSPRARPVRAYPGHGR